MRGAVELPDIHDVVLIFQHGSFVVVHIEVVRSTEDRHHTGETGRPRLSIHAVTGILRLVGSYDGQKVILF